MVFALCLASLGLAQGAAAAEPELITRVRQMRYHEAARLLSAGADPDQRDLHGWTALHHAAGMGFLELVNLLLESGAEASPKDESGVTPLHRAVAKGHAPVVERLLAAGADKAAATREGKTPLHWAAQGGRVGIAKLLLSAGAPVNALDGNGQTPLEDARASTATGRTQAIALLKGAGGKSGRYVRALALYEKRKAGQLPRCRGYREARWGMTREEIIEVLPDVQPLKGSRDLALHTEVARRGATVFFKLPEGRLNAVQIVFDKPAKRLDHASVLADYRRLVDLLTRKYQAPYDQKRAWRTAEPPAGYRESTAVASGQLTLQTTWETDWTQVVLTCLGDGGRARLTLAYNAVVKVGAAPKEEDEAALDDL